MTLKPVTGKNNDNDPNLKNPGKSDLQSKVFFISKFYI